jgi:Flp pilus assembly protein TadG
LTKKLLLRFWRDTSIRLWRDTRGVAAVEFAMILPILCLMLIGCVDFGNFLNEKMQLDGLARACAQYVVQGGNPNNVQANVITNSTLNTSITAAGRTITYTGAQVCTCASGTTVNCTSGSCPAGDYVRTFFEVTLTTTFPTIFPWTGFPNTLSETGFAQMQYQN